MQGRWSQFRTISPKIKDEIFAASLCAFLAVPVFGIGLWFQPGWANGWGRLSQSDVFSAGLTFLVCLSFVALCSAVSVQIGAAAQAAFKHEFSGLGVYVLLVSISIFGCCAAFEAIRTSLFAL